MTPTLTIFNHIGVH